MRTLITLALLLAAGLGMAQTTPLLTGYQYWFDTDTANRHNEYIAPSTTMDTITAPSVAGLALGTHRIYYRLKDSEGRWSSVISRPFTIYHAGPHHIVLLRYWSDTSSTTAPADMTEVEVVPPVQYLQILDSLLFCNWAENAATTVFFQLKDNHGQWSSVLSDTLGVDSVASAPAVPDPIVGDDEVEAGSTHTYTVPEVPEAAGYHWSLPTGWSGDSNTNSIEVTAGSTSGVISVFAYNGCGASDSTSLMVDIPTGIGELSSGGLFHVFPNPTTGNFTVQLLRHAQVRELAVLDATGRLVHSQAVGNAASTVTVDLSSHENGLYLVQVQFMDGARAVERIVKE